MTKIFLSSTFIDLREHRQSVINALIKAKLQPIAMELFGAQAGDANVVSISEIKDSDVFVGIYAQRYGYCPDGDRSVTEMEYLAAKLYQKDRLIFIMDKEFLYPLIDQYSETNSEAITKLKLFKQRLEIENVRDIFTTPDDLALKVVLALKKWMDDHNAAVTSQSFPSQDPSPITFNGPVYGPGVVKVQNGTLNFNYDIGRLSENPIPPEEDKKFKPNS